MRGAARRSAADFNADQSVRALFKEEGHGEEPPYQGATFLYIRGFDRDTGERPIPAGETFWFSPDVELVDAAGAPVLTTSLQAGSSYTVEVVVTNGGDRDCSTCSVELFLTMPSLGFSVAAATALGAQLVSVPRLATTKVRFPFEATRDMVGHRCLFARASSIISNDFPSDWNGLDAGVDRHLGQQNLDIVQQGSLYAFRVRVGAVHRGHNLALVLRPNANVAARPRLPALGPYLVAERPTVGGFEVQRTVVHRTGPRRGGTRDFAPLAREAPGQWTLRTETSDDAMQMTIPNLGLRANEMVALELRLSDPASGATLGGITLLVVA